MLDGSELYVILKLTSGENVMAVLKEEDEERILLETPMIMRTIPIIELGREHITAAPLCQFSDDKVFVIHKKDVMFCKKLHHVFIPHYRKIVAEHENQSLITPDNKRKPLNEESRLTPEDAKKAIDMLSEIADNDEKDLLNYVAGNDTIN